jgi:hypothetical protein
MLYYAFSAMLKIKIIHPKHSGKLRPHELTSYGPLFMLLMVVGVVLTVITASADSGPGSGSVGLTGLMPGPAPKTAATIDSPTDQKHFLTSPINVSGTCPKNTLVEVYKNNIFAGSDVCSDGGSFAFNVDLLNGQNTLIARVYDNLNQQGPDSNSVVIFYDALPSQSANVTSLNFGGAQLILDTDAVYRGVFPNQKFSIPITVLGGTPPYAVNIQWGDSTSKIVPRGDNLTFSVEHAYTKPGTFQINLQATDAQGRIAFISVAAIVNGQPSAYLAASSKATTNQLLVLWPLYTSILAVVISFWLGERREKKLITKPTLHLNPQA